MSLINIFVKTFKELENEFVRYGHDYVDCKLEIFNPLV